MDLIFITPVLFFIVAFVFSMLGMGGSQLYIPILFWLGMDFKTQAIPLGMLLNVVNSLSAVITYGRKKIIDWKVAIPFGLAMVLFAPLGAWLNISLPTKPVILIFALFTAAAAILMLSGWKPKRGEFTLKGKTALGVSGGSVLGFFAGLIGRGGGSFVVPLLYIAQPQWIIWILCVLAVIGGSQLGSRLMATKLKSKYIKIIFGTVLLGIAATLIIQNLLL